MSTLLCFWNAFSTWWVAHQGEIWAALLIVGVVAGAYVGIAARAGPRDSSSNGIVVGRAKQFDNRSLSLILEELDASLRKLSVVSQSIAERPEAFQGSEATTSSRSLTLSYDASISDKKNGEGRGKSREDDSEASSQSKSGGSPPNAPASRKEAPSADAPNCSPAFGMAAADLLADQMNLAYQIVNLRLLNERALSDRLIRDPEQDELLSRVQAVLGFEVSISPPSYANDCVAVAEIEVLVPEEEEPISIVAMIPQEKTYNAATLSSSADSLDGSVVSLLRIGAAVGRRRNNVYLHRDTDTTAFERNVGCDGDGWYGGAFGSVGRRRNVPKGLAAFGWEFRPVLGRRSVSPGARWMLAVAALPKSDPPRAEADRQTHPQGAEGQTPELMVRTKTYWRRYIRKRQTTTMRLGLWPLPLFGPRMVESPWYRLTIYRTSDIQKSLSPIANKVSWTDVGGGNAVVLVEGEHFYSGTEVIIGGIRYRAGDGNLVLKSHRAMEVHTTIAAVAKGDAVLSGRYGASIPLVAKPPGKDWEPLWANGINIDDETVRIQSDQGEAYKFRCLVIPLYAAQGTGAHKPLGLDAFDDRMPHPIICVDEFVVPQHYYFDEGDPTFDGKGTVVARCYVPIAKLVGATPFSSRAHLWAQTGRL